jgi:DNA-binding protein HU-beta
MTKAELIDVVSERTEGLTKKAVAEVVENLFGAISKAVKKDGKLTYPGFGTWTIRTRKARNGRNPQTGELIKIKASKTVGFRPAPALKMSL